MLKRLNLVLENDNWDPEPLVSKDPVFEIQTALIENDTVIIQGPPGTGKTYLMAQICNALLMADFRILVTALTNRALIELAEKAHLKNAFKDGKTHEFYFFITFVKFVQTKSFSLVLLNQYCHQNRERLSRQAAKP